VFAVIAYARVSGVDACSKELCSTRTCCWKYRICKASLYQI